MELKVFTNTYEKEIKKGQFTSAKWQSISKAKDGNEYKKVSNGVIRFVRYGSIKNVEVKGKVNPNEECLIPNTLYYNKNTKGMYVQLAKTKVKPVSTYYCNGEQITKEQFEMANPSKKYGKPSEIFRVRLENLLELGNE